MSRSGRVVKALGSLCLAVTLGASAAQAQTTAPGSPWMVTVAPAMDPLPIGYCGAVYVNMLDPATKDRPRNPAGMLITLADFDMSVVGAGAADVAGEQVGPTNWSACACQGASVGSSATITASYPARSLAAKSRVAGVAFQATAQLRIAPAKGAANPAACAAVSTQTVAATGAGQSLRTAGGGRTPASVAPPATPITPPATSPTTPVAVPAPLGTGTPLGVVGAGAGKVIPTRRPALGLALNPNSLQYYDPMQVELYWAAEPGALRYSITRQEGTNLPVEVLPPQFTGVSFTDWAPDFIPTYSYTLSAFFPDGTTAQSAPVSYLSRRPPNPGGFTAKDNENGTVALSWDVSWGNGDSGYKLYGPGAPSTGLIVPRPLQQTSFPFLQPARQSTTLTNVPPGNVTWRIATRYAGGIYDTATASTVSLAVLPKHSSPWLSKNNGVGSNSQALAHYLPLQSTGTPLYESDILAIAGVSTFKSWINGSPPPGQPLGQWANEAVYGNSGDIGVGRRADCFQEFKGMPTPGIRTVCYAAAHGSPPGAVGFNDPAVITAPGKGHQAGFILAMMIIKDSKGTQFLVFNSTGNTSAKLARAATLDTEGAKFVPHSCISCHGGTYNTTTNRVDNANFLPLDPQLLAFANPTVQAQQEEKIRQLNVMMMNANPTSPVANYVRGLYQNAQLTPYMKAKADYVPTSWAPNQAVYRMIVRPYCVMCHLAGPSYLDFSSYANFQNALALIYPAVCKAGSMPHSELQFKDFWRKPTGAISVPGLLAITTGNQACK